MPYQRILIAIDGSETSNLALQEGIKLAKALNAQVALAYVADIATAVIGEDLTFGVEQYRKSIIAIGEQLLEKKRTLAEVEGVSVEVHLLELTQKTKRIAESLVDDATQWRADLIVIGTHGRRGISKFFLGSVAEEAIRITTTPVLLIRGNHKYD